MKPRNQKPDENYQLTIEGYKFFAYDKETIKVLNWDKYLSNISNVKHVEVEKNREYF